MTPQEQAAFDDLRDALEDLELLWHRTRQSGCLPMQIVRARAAIAAANALIAARSALQSEVEAMQRVLAAPQTAQPDDDLPALPEVQIEYLSGHRNAFEFYNADDLRKYARQAIAQTQAKQQLTENQKYDIVTNWFCDEGEIIRAMQTLEDFEQTTNTRLREQYKRTLWDVCKDYGSPGECIFIGFKIAIEKETK